jgi:hypothetical protein
MSEHLVDRIANLGHDARGRRSPPSRGQVGGQCASLPARSGTNASPSLPMMVLPGNGIPPRRDRWPKIGSGREKVSAETEPPTSKPANCGPLASLREIFRFERLRGGPGSCATLEAAQWLARRCGLLSLFEAKRLFSPSPAPAATTERALTLTTTHLKSAQGWIPPVGIGPGLRLNRLNPTVRTWP